MAVIIRLIVLSTLKLVAMIFWRFSTQQNPILAKHDWMKARLIILLNHTSLYEWLYLGVVPWKFLLRLARKGTFPGAEETLNRPFIGRVFKLMAANPVPISRKRDESWERFLDIADQGGVILFLPEGRMRRRKGLDKNGKPMTVRGGIWDLLKHLKSGKMIIGYSGGLHHVQYPGQLLPKPFRTITLRLDVHDIKNYLDSLGVAAISEEEGRHRLTRDLENKRDQFLNDFRPRPN